MGILSALRSEIGVEMSDLVRREDVIAVLCFCEETKMMLCGDLRKILEKIDGIPSAEPERKHGEWLPHPHEREWDVCSVCGTGCKRREFEMQFGQERFTEYGYQYCPHCGADMRISHE